MQPICLTAFVLAIVAVFALQVKAADLSIRIVLDGSTAMVTGAFTDPAKFPNRRNLSFVGTIAGVSATPARFADLRLFDEGRRSVEYRRLSDGEYLADIPFTSWSYRANLEPPSDLSAKAHFSSISEKSGIVMLRDLLLDVAVGTSAKVELIADQKIVTATKSLGGNVFEVDDVGNAVFYLGSESVQKTLSVGASMITLIIDGHWQTDKDDAIRAVGEILSRYERIFGPRPTPEAIVFLGKFPIGTPVGRWEAETRGASVTIFSSEMSFKTQSVQKLHEQLRHEIFHLWFPNSLNLSGNYDWFYEGFALYSSLKSAVAFNRIRFDDFLDTLARAYDIEKASRRRLSLIDASVNRWNGANTQIYARGLIVAFLTDAAILKRTRGRESLDDILSQLFKKHGPASPRMDANQAILEFLGGRDELFGIIEKYIKSSAEIDWVAEIAPLGIEPGRANGATKLIVNAKLDRRQKDLLDKLGYNNWRKKSK